jgi:ribose transport system substrate-binding protein
VLVDVGHDAAGNVAADRSGFCMKRMWRCRRQVAAVLVAVLALAGLSACTSSGGGSGQKKLGIVALVATDALNQAVIQGATTAAKQAGWAVTVTDTQGSPDKANAAMTTFSTTQKMDAILVCAFDSNAIGAGLASAKSANIPVVSWGGQLIDGIAAVTSALKVGEDSVNAMLKDFGNSGSVLALTYHTGILCKYRGIAFDAAMKKEPGIQVTRDEVAIPGQVQDGTKFTAGWLAQHPKGSGPLAIWGSWDEPGMGAIAALKEAGRTDVKVYSINGSPQALKSVQTGDMTQVIWQDGRTEGSDLFNAAKGAVDEGDNWKPKSIDVPGVLVDKSTISAFLKDHPSAIS